MTNFEYSMKEMFHLNLNWIKSYFLYYTCIVLKWTITFLCIYCSFKPKKCLVLNPLISKVNVLQGPAFSWWVVEDGSFGSYKCSYKLDWAVLKRKTILKSNFKRELENCTIGNVTHAPVCLYGRKNRFSIFIWPLIWIKLCKLITYALSKNYAVRPLRQTETCLNFS